MTLTPEWLEYVTNLRENVEPTCPRCGRSSDEYRMDEGFPRPGAISRWDNKTVICSECGD